MTGLIKSINSYFLKKEHKNHFMEVNKFNVDDQVDIEENESKKDLTPTIQIEVQLPPSLQTRVFKNENSVNLLKIATVIYNNELNDKPQTGFGKVIIILGNEKMTYDYRIHSISFNPTMDLENTQLFAEISSTDNKMIQRLITDKVLGFYLSGKLTLKEDEEIDTIFINKIISHVDQTAYAKKFDEIRKKNDTYIKSLPDNFIKERIFHDPNWDEIKMSGVAEVWKQFMEKHTKPVYKNDTPLKNPSTL